VTPFEGYAVKYVVGVADARVSREPGDVLVTHALGSCLGITVYDPFAHVGGLLHVMMPEGRANPEKSAANPYMFVDTGVPAFFHDIYGAGAVKGRCLVKVAGGANVSSVANDRFEIGKRNYVILKKLLWVNNILIRSQDVGGSIPRTMYLEIGSGRVWLQTAGVETDL
jgi:chemotaxis protein CheD